MKKAQITAFAIIGILTILLIVAAFYIRGVSIERSGEFKVATRPVLTGIEAQVNEYVESCVKDVARSNLRFIGQQGGYFNPVPSSTDFNIPYYVDRGENLMPLRSKVESEISASIDEGLPLCIKDFEVFEDLEIEAGDVSTKTIMNEEKVVIQGDYPLKIFKQDEQFRIDDFYVEIPVRFGKMYDVTEKIIDDQVKNPEGICINCYVTEALKNDFYYKVQRYGDDVIIFTMIDFNETRTHLPFNFTYAVRY